MSRNSLAIDFDEQGFLWLTQESTSLRDALVAASGEYKAVELGSLSLLEWESIIREVWKPSSDVHKRAVKDLET